MNILATIFILHRGTAMGYGLNFMLERHVLRGSPKTSQNGLCVEKKPDRSITTANLFDIDRFRTHSFSRRTLSGKQHISVNAALTWLLTGSLVPMTVDEKRIENEMSTNEDFL